MEDDIEMQENVEENNVELTEDFIKKIKGKECQICTIIELLSFFQIDEKKGRKESDNEIVKITKEYLKEFNKYGLTQDYTAIAANVRKALDSGKKFSKLEEALLIDLAPSTADEAFSLIPSLKKKLKAEEMEEYLAKLNKEIIPS